MMIYYLLAKGTTHVKIGYTRNYLSLSARIASLQTGCPHELALMAIEPGELSDEAEIHQEFDHLRIRGEWFELGEDLQNKISQKQIVADKDKFFKYFEAILKKALSKRLEETGFIAFYEIYFQSNRVYPEFFIGEFIKHPYASEFEWVVCDMFYSCLDEGKELNEIFFNCLKSINPFVIKSIVLIKDANKTDSSYVVYGSVEKFCKKYLAKNPTAQLRLATESPPAFDASKDELLNAELSIKEHFPYFQKELKRRQEDCFFDFEKGVYKDV